MIHLFGQIARRGGPDGPHRQMPLRKTPVAVMHDHRKTRPQQARRKVSAQVAKAHISIPHQTPHPTIPLISQKSWMPQSAYSRPFPDCL